MVVSGAGAVKHHGATALAGYQPRSGSSFLNRTRRQAISFPRLVGFTPMPGVAFPRDYSQRLLIDERLICEIVKKDLVVWPLENRHLQHQDRYQLFLRIDKKGGSPDSPPREFAGFS